jgi:hypothetical protein
MELKRLIYKWKQTGFSTGGKEVKENCQIIVSSLSISHVQFTKRCERLTDSKQGQNESAVGL